MIPVTIKSGDPPIIGDRRSDSDQQGELNMAY